MERELTPRQVAAAIGVSEASLKRWCDKGILEATRTVGGHRRLSIAEVMRFLQERGRPLVNPEVLGLPRGTGTGEHSLDRTWDRFQRALEDGDIERVRRAIFDVYLANLSIAQIGDRIIAPAFESLGSKWEHGTLEVFKERRACDLSQQVLNELRFALDVPRDDAPTAIGASLENDVYALPTMLVELTLREIGINAQSLGTGLPAETMIAAIEELKPNIAWLSISHITDLESLVSGVRQIHQTASRIGTSLVLGGRGADLEVRRRLTFTAHCDTLAHLVAFSKPLLAGVKNSSELK